MMQAAAITKATERNLQALLVLVEQYWAFEEIAGVDRALLSTQLARIVSDSRLGEAWIARIACEAAAYLIGVYVFSLEHAGLTPEGANWKGG